MLNKAFKNKKGITLIALIITIIVLLILAGVTIAAITSNESAPNKAVEARTKNEQGAEFDAIKLAAVSSIAEGDYTLHVNEETLKRGLTGLIQEDPEDVITAGASEWVVTGNSGVKYRITNLGDVTLASTVDIVKNEEIVTGETLTFAASATGTTVQLVAQPTADLTLNSATWESNNTSVATVTNSGLVTIAGGGETTISLTASTSGGNFAKSVTVKVAPSGVKVGDTVNYSTSHNGVTLDTWKVFHIDSTNNYVWIILSDYLPYNAIGSISGLAQGTAGSTAQKSYCVKASNNRSQLINGMGSSNWTSLKTGTLDGNNVTAIDAMGSPTIQLWSDSWNTASNGFTTTITTSQNSTGYQVNGANSLSIPSGDKSKTNYSLYVPHNSAYENCSGYWLASPSALSASNVMGVGCGGIVNGYYYGFARSAFRPVVCLPSSVFE